MVKASKLTLEYKLLNEEVKALNTQIKCMEKIVECMSGHDFLKEVRWCYVYEYFAGYTHILDCYKNYLKLLKRYVAGYYFRCRI